MGFLAVFKASVYHITCIMSYVINNWMLQKRQRWQEMVGWCWSSAFLKITYFVNKFITVIFKCCNILSQFYYFLILYFTVLVCKKTMLLNQFSVGTFCFSKCSQTENETSQLLRLEREGVILPKSFIHFHVIIKKMSYSFLRCSDNLMTSSNLATVFVPCLLPPPNKTEMSEERLELRVLVLRTFIEFPHVFGNKLIILVEYHFKISLADFLLNASYFRCDF